MNCILSRVIGDIQRTVLKKCVLDLVRMSLIVSVNSMKLRSFGTLRFPPSGAPPYFPFKQSITRAAKDAYWGMQMEDPSCACGCGSWLHSSQRMRPLSRGRGSPSLVKDMATASKEKACIFTPSLGDDGQLGIERVSCPTHNDQLWPLHRGRNCPRAYLYP